MVKNRITIFVEGGGDSSELRGKCRKAFSKFFEKAGLVGKMPRIVACGPRNAAFDSYCIAVKQGDKAMLLVDSESPVHNISGSPQVFDPWPHLKIRDGWVEPKDASSSDCYLMVQVMETWFLADVSALEKYFGKGFNTNSLPKRSNLEEIPKSDVEDSLNAAAKGTKKKGYEKGRDSFEILATIDPYKVMDKSPWADHFVKLLSLSCFFKS